MPKKTASREVSLVIGKDGSVKGLYTDDINFGAFGTPKIRRVSRVEPDRTGRWWADMKPVRGPRLGPFKKRQDALDAEVKWLKKNILK